MYVDSKALLRQTWTSRDVVKKKSNTPIAHLQKTWSFDKSRHESFLTVWRWVSGRARPQLPAVKSSESTEEAPNGPALRTATAATNGVPSSPRPPLWTPDELACICASRQIFALWLDDALDLIFGRLRCQGFEPTHLEMAERNVIAQLCF